MSKYLDKAIKEMKNYSDMGLPDGENGGGMGSESKNPVVNAYRMNNILRRRQQAEEEEMEMSDDEGKDMDNKDYKMDLPGNEAGMEVPNMDGDEMGMGDDEMGMAGDEVDTEEMKAFFQDNMAPSDEEVQAYADERGIDMEQMRQEVYALIQALLGDGDPVGDGEEEMGGEVEFEVPVNDENDIPHEKDLNKGGM